MLNRGLLASILRVLANQLDPPPPPPPEPEPRFRLYHDGSVDDATLEALAVWLCDPDNQR